MKRNYKADDWGPSDRFYVFLCSRDGHVMHAAWGPEVYRSCPSCGSSLISIKVQPVPDDER